MDQRSEAPGDDRLESFGEELEACRGYLTLAAERAIPPSLRPKLGASDLVQETFVDARRRLGDLRARDRHELRAWLYRVMMLNLAEQKRTYFATAKSDVRREVRDDPTIAEGRPSLLEGVPDDRPTPASAAMTRERLSRLAEALGELAERDRRAILLRYAEGLNFAEIGRRLDGLSEDAARKLYGRACRRLLDRIGGASP
jgi:RNA polymerase sigma-70 factor (ECF subfamily)